MSLKSLSATILAAFVLASLSGCANTSPEVVDGKMRYVVVETSGGG